MKPEKKIQNLEEEIAEKKWLISELEKLMDKAKRKGKMRAFRILEGLRKQLLNAAMFQELALDYAKKQLNKEQ